jgi:hypothetical protein
MALRSDTTTIRIFKTILLNDKSIESENILYKKKDCKFIICNSCYWITTIIKNNVKIIKCPICKKNELLSTCIF